MIVKNKKPIYIGEIEKTTPYHFKGINFNGDPIPHLGRQHIDLYLDKTGRPITIPAGSVFKKTSDFEFLGGGAEFESKADFKNYMQFHFEENNTLVFPYKDFRGNGLDIKTFYDAVETADSFRVFLFDFGYFNMTIDEFIEEYFEFVED